MTRQEKEFLLLCYYRRAFEVTHWGVKLEDANSKGNHQNAKRFREQMWRHYGAREMLRDLVCGLYEQSGRKDTLDAEDMKKVMDSLLRAGQCDALIDPENPQDEKSILRHIRAFDIDDDEEETL